MRAYVRGCEFEFYLLEGYCGVVEFEKCRGVVLEDTEDVGTGDCVGGSGGGDG